jgi:hypothetical protein
MKFFSFFLLLWVIFALLDPDPDSESGSGSTDPIESGSATLLFSKTHFCSLLAGDHRRGQVQACFCGNRAGSARHRQGCRHGLQGHRLRVQVAEISHDYGINVRLFWTLLR